MDYDKNNLVISNTIIPLNLLNREEALNKHSTLTFQEATIFPTSDSEHDKLNTTEGQQVLQHTTTTIPHANWYTHTIHIKDLFIEKFLHTDSVIYKNTVLGKLLVFNKKTYELINYISSAYLV